MSWLKPDACEMGIRLATRLTPQALISWLKLDADEMQQKDRHLTEVPGADVLVETGRR